VKKESFDDVVLQQESAKQLKIQNNSPTKQKKLVLKPRSIVID